MTPGSIDYYAVEELLTDEERAARDRTRRFVQEEVMSEIVPCHRAGKFPEHLTPRMGALGFFAPHLKEYGGAGLSYTAYGLIMQKLERADSGLRSQASVQGALAINAIHSFGSPEQQECWLPVFLGASSFAAVTASSAVAAATRNLESVGCENGFALILVQSRHGWVLFHDLNQLSKWFADHKLGALHIRTPQIGNFHQRSKQDL